jgi:hypothetical protein
MPPGASGAGAAGKIGPKLLQRKSRERGGWGAFRPAFRPAPPPGTLWKTGPGL